MNSSNLENVSRNLVLWLNISRFVLPALSLLSILFPQPNQNSVGVILGRLVSAVFGYILTTWWAEWVARISSILLEERTDQTQRVQKLTETLGRWMRAFQVIIAIFGVLLVVILLIRGLTTGIELPMVVFYVIIEIVFWVGYAVMGWYKAWITDATLWTEMRRVTYAFGALSKTLRNWYMVALVCNVIMFLYLMFISLSALPMPSEARTAIFLTALGGLVLNTATGWYWREFFGAFTAHATATPAANTTTNPASL